VVASESLQTYLQGAHREDAQHSPTPTSAIDREIERLVRTGIISMETALANASDPQQLSKTFTSD